MVRQQSDSCLVVPKRAYDSPTESQQESPTKKGRGDCWKLMVRQQSDSCLVIPKRACDSPQGAVSKENLYDLFSSGPPTLASSSTRPQMRRLTTPPRLLVASKINQQIQERRLHHLHLVPQLDLIGEQALEECIIIIDESTAFDRDGVSSDTVLTIPKRRGSPHENSLKTPCILPADADTITRVGNLVSPK
jgi:hypothetical protein